MKERPIRQHSRASKVRAPRPFGPRSFAQHLAGLKFELANRRTWINQAKQDLAQGEELLAEYQADPELNPGCSLQQWGEELISKGREALAELCPRPLAALAMAEARLR